MQTIICQSPAKILLSGEHAVVHGLPGLSMAINLFTICEIHFTPSADNNLCDYIEIELPDYQQKHAFPFPIWQKLALNIDTRYRLYEASITSINTVLCQPIDLILVTLQHFHNIYRIKHGHLSIKITSHHLPSRGLGSSASVIMSLLKALCALHDIKRDQDTLIDLARTIESYQHGSSSGIDPATVLLGGLLKYQRGQYPTHLNKHPFQAWLIDTGKPTSSTGQCVAQVSQNFPKDHPIWDSFKTVTLHIEQAWQNEDAALLNNAVRRNQALLEDIGVVPKSIKAFIRQLHAHENVAVKACGSGATKGDAAGMLLCISPKSCQTVQQLCQQMGFEIIPLVLDEQGTHIRA